jgi:hypothetical protein
VEGWYLDFPFYGNATRGIPEHPMNRWEKNGGTSDIAYVGRLGREIAFRDLPNELKTDGVAVYFGAAPETLSGGGGVVVCGSLGEIANDPSLDEHFDVRSNEQTTVSSDQMNNQKSVVWTEIALNEPDQVSRSHSSLCMELLMITQLTSTNFQH